MRRKGSQLSDNKMGIILSAWENMMKRIKSCVMEIGTIRHDFGINELLIK